jgi:hypothetical protein
MAGHIRDVAVVLVVAGLVGGCTPSLPLRQEKPNALQDGSIKGSDKPIVRADTDPSPYHEVSPLEAALRGSKGIGGAQAMYLGLQGEQADGHLRPDKLPDPPVEHVPGTAKVITIVPAEPVPPEQPAQAEQQVPVKLEPPDDPVVVALQCILDKRPEDAIKALNRIDKSNQELLLGLLALVARLNGSGLDQAKPHELAALIQQVESLELPLRSRAPLKINELCFCREATRFGCYEPIRDQPPTFQAAGEGRDGEFVQVYLEVSNFTVEQRVEQGKTDYVAKLVSSLEVRDLGGHRVWGVQCGDKPDVSRSPWRDHCICIQFRIPPELKPGHYTLWVQVQDVLTKPLRPPAPRSLDFRVIAQGSVAGPKSGPGLASK